MVAANAETIAMFGRAAHVKPEPERPKLLSFKSLDPSDVYSPLSQQTNKQTVPEQTNTSSVLHNPWISDQKRTGGRTLMKKTFSLANLLHINRYQISKPTTSISADTTSSTLSSSSTFSSSTFSLANLLHTNRNYQISKPTKNIPSSSSSSSSSPSTFSSLKKLLGKPWWRSSRLKGTKSKIDVRRRWTEMGLGDASVDEIDRFERDYVGHMVRQQKEDDLCYISQQDRSRSLGCLTPPESFDPLAKSRSLATVEFVLGLQEAEEDNGIGWEDKQDGLASIQEDEVSPREKRLNCQEKSSEAFYKEGRLTCQEKSSEAFYPSSSPPTKAFYLSSANEDEEGEVALALALAALKRHSRDESLLSISSSDLSSCYSSEEEEEELEFLVERGDHSLPERIESNKERPESNFNKEEEWNNSQLVLSKSPLIGVTDQEEVKGDSEVLGEGGAEIWAQRKAATLRRHSENWAQQLELFRRHSGGDEATFWTEKKQNLEETLKDSFAEDNVNGFLEVEGGDPVFNWSPKKERLFQGSPRLRGPGGDLRGWRSEKDVGRGGGEASCQELEGEWGTQGYPLSGTQYQATSLSRRPIPAPRAPKRSLVNKHPIRQIVQPAKGMARSESLIAVRKCCHGCSAKVTVNGVCFHQ